MLDTSLKWHILYRSAIKRRKVTMIPGVVVDRGAKVTLGSFNG